MPMILRPLSFQRYSQTPIRAFHLTKPPPLCHDGGRNHGQGRFKRRRRGVMFFSTNRNAKQESQATLVEVNTGLRTRLRVGGTYGNYEALKSPSRPSDNATTATKTREVSAQQQRSGQFRKVRTANTPTVAAQVKAVDKSHDKGEPGPQLVHLNKENVNTHEWQRLMQKTAGDAYRLSQAKVNLKDTKAIEAGRKRLDYNAWYIDAPKSSMERSLPVPWALNLSEMSGVQGTELLDWEIQNFARFLDCSPAENAAREAVISATTALITNTLSGVKSEVFGSQVTGLATTTSDVDIRLFWAEGNANPRTLTDTMKPLIKALTDSDEFICVVMRYSKYPIITTQHKRTGIDIQIVSAPDTKPQQEVTAEYLSELPHLRSVYAVLKTAFGIRGLVDVVNGGIGSYGLFMMLVASLKRRSNSPPVTAGEQLLRFLESYSELDMEKYGVSTAPPKLFKKHNAWELPIKEQIDAARRRGDTIRAAQWAIGQRRLYQPYLFCLQDPANPLNDLGRKSNAIKHLQRTIVVLRNTLKRHVADVSAAVERRAPWEEDSTLLPLVGRCHEIYYERRKKAEEYGLQLMMRKQGEAKMKGRETTKAAD